MKATKLKEAFAIGMVITLVLAIIAYILIKIGGELGKIIIPIAHQLGM